MITEKRLNTIYKKDIIKSIAEDTGRSVTDLQEIIDLFIHKMGQNLSTKWRISLTGFGTFEIKERKARMGINPRTKEPMEIPSRLALTFKTGTLLKQLIKDTPTHTPV